MNCLMKSYEKKMLHVETGSFGAMMEVELVNDGPVTIILETKDGKIVELA